MLKLKGQEYHFHQSTDVLGDMGGNKVWGWFVTMLGITDEAATFDENDDCKKRLDRWHHARFKRSGLSSISSDKDQSHSSWSWLFQAFNFQFCSRYYFYA